MRAYGLRRAEHRTQPAGRAAEGKPRRQNARSAVAGGIKLATIEGIAAEKPAILIVGGGITGQADKRATALK